MNELKTPANKIGTEQCKFYHIVIHDEGKLVVGILKGGEVEFGPEFTADFASKEFWKVMGELVRKTDK